MPTYEGRLHHSYKKSIPHFMGKNNPVKHMLALCSILWQGNQEKIRERATKQRHIHVLPRLLFVKKIGRFVPKDWPPVDRRAKCPPQAGLPLFWSDQAKSPILVVLFCSPGFTSQSNRNECKRPTFWHKAAKHSDNSQRYTTQSRITAKRCYRTPYCPLVLDRLVSVSQCQYMLQIHCLNVDKITAGSV
jgi:hypothetical protein